MDAMTSVGLCYYVDCNIRECGGVWQGDSDATDVPSYKELIFTVDEKILNAIDTAEISYNTLVGFLFETSQYFIFIRAYFSRVTNQSVPD